VLEILHIKNYALIDKAEVSFASGFNIFSGETGAGKSVLIGALGLLLGARSENGVIRRGAEEADLSAEFRIEGKSEALEWLKDRDISPDDDRIILRRVIRENKRGNCYIQGVPVTLGDLAEFTGLLVDMHGQHEHQSLFNNDIHRILLDSYSGLADEVNLLKEEFSALSALKKEYQDCLESEKDREEEMVRLQKVISELSAAELRVGEKDELLADLKLLQNHERLYKELDSVRRTLDGGNGNVLDGLRIALEHLGTAQTLDPGLAPELGRLDAVLIEIEDIASVLRTRQYSRDYSQDKVDEIQDRVARIQSLEKKHGPTEAYLLEKLSTATQKLERLTSLENDLRDLTNHMAEQEKRVMNRAGEISRRRQEGALGLQKEVLAVISQLGMAKSRFEVSMKRKTSEQGKLLCGPQGYDQVEFMISANPGEPLRPLRQIASGGELSRVMLALKTVLAESDNIPVLIFDEIDAGIGGEVGLTLGQYLQKLSESKQVLCISHLASIASSADHHLLVEKISDTEQTTTLIRSIKGEERVREISRMLSGDAEHDTSLEHGRKLLEKNSRFRPGA